MKKKKLKLSFEKETIAKLQDSEMNNVMGGVSDSFECGSLADIVTNFTKGDCDLPTIGHDDGSWCLSKEADWCHGR